MSFEASFVAVVKITFQLFSNSSPDNSYFSKVSEEDDIHYTTFFQLNEHHTELSQSSHYTRTKTHTEDTINIDMINAGTHLATPMLLLPLKLIKQVRKSTPH